jgi:hypothetical protein
LLYFSAPAYAAFSKLEVYTSIIGRDLNTIRPWLFQWGELGLIQICGKNAVNLQAVLEACKAIPNHPGVLRFQDFVINTDVIVLSTPEIAGLPYVISGLVALTPRRRFPPPTGFAAIANALSTMSTTRCSIQLSILRRLTVAACCCSSWPCARLILLRPNRRTSWPWSKGIRSPWPAISGHCARHLVETRDYQRHLRDHRRLGHLPVLPHSLEVLPAGRRVHLVRPRC